MLSVLVCPSHELATPFQCLHFPNTDYSLKCSPKLQLGSTPSQRNPFKCFCNRKEHVTPFSQGFSELQEDDSPWESGNVWSNLALYLFTLHIPFSFGGLSVVALFNGQPVLDPQTEALSLLTIQILEFGGALVLLKYTAKPQYKFSNFSRKNKLLSNRNCKLRRVESCEMMVCNVQFFSSQRVFVLSFVLLMGGFEQKMKDRAKELKVLLKKGVKIVGDSCKKGWNKVKHIKR
ncbi:hypothetical protein JHK85_017246 [Glycine max]|nr:hypothetical protein JHK85_017246 [Glycine max]